MTESPLAKKLAERKEQLKRAEHNALLAELLDLDRESLSWTEDRGNEELAEEMISSKNIVFSVRSDREVYIAEAIAQIKGFLDLSESENVFVSIRLPSYAFTNFFSLKAMAFPEFLDRFLHQYDAIVFLLKTSANIFVFGNSESDLEVFTRQN